MSNIRPTKKQHELLGFIEQFIKDNGYSPSYREIMNGLQYTSVATVALHVNNLIKRGHLRKRDHSARSLEVVQNPEPAATTDSDDNQEVGSRQEEEPHVDWLVAKARGVLAGGKADAQVIYEALDVLGFGDQAAELRLMPVEVREELDERLGDN